MLRDVIVNKKQRGLNRNMGIIRRRMPLIADYQSALRVAHVVVNLFVGVTANPPSALANP